MPAYNAEKYIGEAIESILNQTFRDFEFIIIDDCSTDKTWEIIQNYSKIDSRIISLKNIKNSRICITLNRGIEIAQGKYIARMDADDWSYPNRLEKQVMFMDNNPDIVLSGGAIEVCGNNLNILNTRKYNITDSEIRDKIFRYSPFCHPATMYKTIKAIESNGYDERLADAEDYDFYFRMGLLGKFGNLKDTILRLRTSRTSISRTRSRRQEKLTLLIRKLAVNNYGYKMSYFDKVYTTAQLFSMYLIPQEIKFKLFNYLRK